MIHKTTVPPTFLPVTVDECRYQMGVSNAGDNSRDLIIESRIRAVTRWFENLTATKICQQTVTAYGCEFGDDPINLIRPLQSVISIHYIDSAGVDMTLLNTDYQVSTVFNRVSPAFDIGYYPFAREQDESVRIEYVSGYASADLIPVEIKEAILFTVGAYEQFQPAIEAGIRPQTVPYAALQLMQEHMDYREWF
jgi:uncharacterized phiE125 gp8 family phage protein